ncbi:hypothetical protein [Thermococcus sp.]
MDTHFMVRWIVARVDYINYNTNQKVTWKMEIREAVSFTEGLLATLHPWFAVVVLDYKRDLLAIVAGGRPSGFS